MSKAIKTFDEIFRNFIFKRSDKRYLIQKYADYLSSYIHSGYLPFGYEFPTVAYLHIHNHLAYHVIHKALWLLSAKGYIKMGRGITTHVIFQSDRNGNYRNFKHQIYADYHCQPPNHLTVKTEKNFLNSKAFHMGHIRPGQENVISPSLIATAEMRFNEMHKLVYERNNFYYTHSYAFMIRSIIKAIYIKKGVMVISKQVDPQFRTALKSLSIKIIEVGSDEQGIDLTALQRICKIHKVCGVFIMSRASFPECNPTSAKRLRELLHLQEQHDFKIVENNFFEPWLIHQHNLLLSMAANPLKSIIYVYPFNYSVKEISEISCVAADAATINLIRMTVITDGKNARLSVAEATSEALLFPDYQLEKTKVRTQLAKAIAIIREVFNGTGYWDTFGISQDSGMAIFLRPMHGFFPSDAFSRLSKMGILIHDPKSYYGCASDGIRLDLTYYISNNNLKEIVVWVEEVCRKMCQPKR